MKIFDFQWSTTLLLTCIISVYGAGTIKNIQEVFIGRCWEYQQIINPSAFTSGTKNCSRLWTLFSGVFINKEPCIVRRQDYQPFVDAAWHPTPTDKSLFWENVFPFVNDYSHHGKRYTTIADTLLGYMVSPLNDWCGQTGPPGINHNSCPSACGDDNLPPSFYYWHQSSIKFAELAHGTVQVMFNGTSARPAYTNTSVFSRFELPNINRSRVNTIRLLMANRPNQAVRETCGTGSIQLFQKRVEERTFRYQCQENPKDILHMMCVDASDAASCSFQRSTSNAQPMFKTPEIIIVTAILGVLHVALLVNERDL